MKALPLLALALACAALVLSLSSPIVLAEVSVCSAPSDGFKVNTLQIEPENFQPGDDVHYNVSITSNVAVSSGCYTTVLGHDILICNKTQQLCQDWGNTRNFCPLHPGDEVVAVNHLNIPEVPLPPMDIFGTVKVFNGVHCDMASYELLCANFKLHINGATDGHVDEAALASLLDPNNC